LSVAGNGRLPPRQEMVDQLVARIDQCSHLLVMPVHELSISADRKSESKPGLVEFIGRLVFGLGFKDPGYQPARQFAHRLLVHGCSLLVQSSGQLTCRGVHRCVRSQVLQQVLDLLKDHDVSPDASQHLVRLRCPDMRLGHGFFTHVGFLPGKDALPARIVKGPVCQSD
jgi:hypothetical protein